jgi:rhamnose utilization protein RhaD (predicted bifunctional aldolase and dehydrogenase)/NAD(P)-dependent dehydrogenase (short-subunit alcohol dehydrogenase family)
MQSRWDEARARACVVEWGGKGICEDLALRTYSARLLGADPALVLHGGGNTSVKTRAGDLFGEEIDVLCVKGSGWDLATIEPAGHPVIRLSPLLRLRELGAVSDEAMVNALRQNLLDQAAANPSVETLLHAFIPAKFIDHTHAVAVLALANQPGAKELLEEAYGERVSIVPYVMPGFDLARAAASAWEETPHVEGLILLNHGIFSFGATARESYERMIDLVDAAETVIAKRRRPAPTPRPESAPSKGRGEILSTLRGALGRAAPDGVARRWILDLRAKGAAAAVAADPKLAELADRGVATPDHVIRTKRAPLVLAWPSSDLEAWGEAAATATRAYIEDYQAYFDRNVARFPGGKRALDPLPRVVAIEGLGLVGLGTNAGAAAIAADIAESWAATLLAAEDVGRFEPLGEEATFDMEYWALEQAKLGRGGERRLERHIVVVTGGGGAIGAAIGAAFAAEGAQVAVLDLTDQGAGDAAAAIGNDVLALACDVTDVGAVQTALERVCERFGGVDIAVSNAGAAITGMIADVSAEALRQSFEINFFAHQNFASAAVGVLRRQALGGALLFNVSKQAINPGPDFGPYGIAKAAELALMRQYALEHGGEGIRVNAVNPDRIRSGLLTEDMIAARAQARNLPAADYMRSNLLGEEVTAADVAQAFVFAALMKKTTGAVIPVDGGNVAAMPR